MRGLYRRYSLFAYNSEEFAIDCEDCNCKVANLNKKKSTDAIIEQIKVHEEVHHGTV